VSTRPRFAADGVLRLSVEVALETDREPVLTGRVGEQTYDPFGRVASSDLLLVEEFARLDLSAARSLPAWYEQHGAVRVERSEAFDHDQLLPPRRGEYTPLWSPRLFRDPLRFIAAEQRSVAWHLDALARLSEHLLADGPWDPAWAHPPLDIGRSHATIAGPDGPAADPAWWAEDDASEQTSRAHHRKRTRLRLLAGLGDGPGSLMELQRRLISPYLFGVADYHLRLGWTEADAEPTDMAQRGPLVVQYTRSWATLLTPVYVQILEGLRRISESERGGAFCRECGRPFLVLDARRAYFCNDRERYRNAARLRRQRLGATRSAVEE